MRKIYILLLIIICFKAYGLKPDSVYTVHPENWALIYKEMDIKTDDGYKIKTWFYPAQEIKSSEVINDYYNNPRMLDYQLIDSIPRPTIIICNGDAGNMIGLISFAMGYIDKGYNVVTFDWRGFGESDKFPINQNLLCHTEFLIDYESVIDSISTIDEVDSKNIGVYGFSTGAYLSFAVAYKNENVNCFAGRALMTSFDDFLPMLFELKPEKRNTVRKPNDYPEELYPINIAPKFKKPTFLIVGSEDKITPPFMSEDIYRLLMGEKDLWIVKGASHGGAKGPEYIDRQVFFNKTTDFYDKHLKH